MVVDVTVPLLVSLVVLLVTVAAGAVSSHLLAHRDRRPRRSHRSQSTPAAASALRCRRVVLIDAA